MLRSVMLVALALAALVAFSRDGLAETVAITFDDLPQNGTLPNGITRSQVVTDVLAILKDRHVPTVYGFVNASKLEGDPDGAEALRLWVAGGQQVGNHSYSHPDLHQTAVADYLRDVRRNEPVLELLDPAGDWRWFRYPFLREGETVAKRREVRGQLRAWGYRTAQVTLDYEDYLWNSPYARCRDRGDQAAIAGLRASYLATASAYLDANRQMAQLIYGREINHVLLLHLGAFSKEILPDLLDLLQRKGFTLVTLQEAQADPIYDGDPDAGSRYGGTLLEQWMDRRSIPYPVIPKKPYHELEALCR